MHTLGQVECSVAVCRRDHTPAHACLAVPVRRSTLPVQALTNANVQCVSADEMLHMRTLVHFLTRSWLALSRFQFFFA